MRKIGTASILLVMILLSACKSEKHPDLSDGMYAEITTTKGVIVALLEHEKTPNTVANFVTLTEGTNPFVDEKFKNKPFYNGMLIQRNDYVIQTGDPKGEGSGTGYVFADEFPHDNEANFLLTHDAPGTLSMANSGINTNSSQFFITFNKAPSLDGKHVVFGHVAKGQDVVDALQSDDVIDKIEIIRKGKSAKKFNAVSVFTDSYLEFKEKSNKKAEEVLERNKKAEKAKKQMSRYFFNNERLAKEFPSGLKMIVTKKGNGKKPKIGSRILIDFSGFTKDGNLFSTSLLEVAEIFNMYNEQFDQDNKYRPMNQIYSEKAGLIDGLIEGMLKMEYGEKALIFIPYQLAYGDKGDGYMIGPKTDLVVEFEILDQILDE